MTETCSSSQLYHLSSLAKREEGTTSRRGRKGEKSRRVEIDDSEPKKKET